MRTSLYNLNHVENEVSFFKKKIFTKVQLTLILTNQNEMEPLLPWNLITCNEEQHIPCEQIQAKSNLFSSAIKLSLK